MSGQRDLFSRQPIKRQPPSAVVVALRAAKSRDKAERIVSICRVFGLPLPVREHQFTPARRWRFDCAWIAQKLAVEVHGGAFTGGRHNTGAGLVADSEKNRAAVLLGWRVLVFTTKDLAQNKAPWVAECLGFALGGGSLDVLVSILKRRWTARKGKP